MQPERWLRRRGHKSVKVWGSVSWDLLSIFAWMLTILSEFTILTQPLPDLKLARSRNYGCKTGLSLISNYGCMSPTHVSSGIHSGSVVTFLLPGLFCSRCLRSLQKSLSTKEAMVTSYRHSSLVVEIVNNHQDNTRHSYTRREAPAQSEQIRHHVTNSYCKIRGQNKCQIMNVDLLFGKSN